MKWKFKERILARELRMMGRLALSVMVTSNLQQIGAGTTEGLIIQPALDSDGNPAKIGFLGGPAVAQRAGGNQVAVSQQSPNGVVININSVALTPTNVSTVSTAAVVLTMTGAGVLSSDHVVVNKITNTQAGLGIGNARAGVTADTVVVQYVNLSAAVLTPTAAESYLVAAMRGLATSSTLTPAAIGSNSAVEQTFTVPGLAPGMLVNVIKPTDQSGLTLGGARVVSNNTLGITFLNATAALITPTANEAYSYVNLNGLNPVGNTLIYGCNIGTSFNSTVSQQAIEQNLTVSGILATDITVGAAMRATSQSSAIPIMSRITAANVIAMTIMNGSTQVGITPTASEVWYQSITRAAPVAPLALYSVALTPSAVAPNTTAEQGFTVTGLVASTVVLVNKPSFTSGLGVVGYRVSAVNTLAITFANPSSQTITPPSETYLVGNFQNVVGVGNNLRQPASPAQNASINLVNEIRAALDGLNLIAGA